VGGGGCCWVGVVVGWGGGVGGCGGWFFRFPPRLSFSGGALDEPPQRTVKLHPLLSRASDVSTLNLHPSPVGVSFRIRSIPHPPHPRPLHPGKGLQGFPYVRGILLMRPPQGHSALYHRVHISYVLPPDPRAPLNPRLGLCFSSLRPYSFSIHPFTLHYLNRSLFFRPREAILPPPRNNKISLLAFYLCAATPFPLHPRPPPRVHKSPFTRFLYLPTFPKPRDRPFQSQPSSFFQRKLPAPLSALYKLSLFFSQ